MVPEVSRYLFQQPVVLVFVPCNQQARPISRVRPGTGFSVSRSRMWKMPFLQDRRKVRRNPPGLTGSQDSELTFGGAKSECHSCVPGVLE